MRDNRSPATSHLLVPDHAILALITAALVIGSGGINAPFGNMAVQLCALAVLAWHAPQVAAFARSAPIGLRLLVVATILLPLIQMVPLPPALWLHLPGRDLVAQSLDLAGGAVWFPISVFPARTLVAFLGLLAPLAIVAVGFGLDAQRLVKLQRAVIALGCATALFGSTHLLNDGWGDLYAAQQAMPGVIVGTFADRNGYALFLDCCLLLLAGLPALPRGAPHAWFSVGAGAFLTLCVVLTGSRTGMVLLAAPTLLLVWRTIAHVRGAPVEDDGRPGKRAIAWSAALAAALILAVGAVVASGRGQASIARFELGDGMRADMREDARFVAARYWPVGAGMGTFDEVFQIDESLEYVSPRRAGHAHMDYLELAIEAGLAGLGLAAAWVAWTLRAGWLAVRRPGAWPARAAVLAIGAVAAQSLLSFPLRNQGMLCIAALLVVLLARSPIAAVAGKPA